MSPLAPLDVAVLAVGLALPLASLYFVRCRRSSLAYPPGPKGHILIGNLLDMPKSREWETFTSWRKIYGDLVFLDVLRTPFLVINSLEAATTLLDKRGSIYADRPRFAVGGELVGWDHFLGMSRYGDRVRSQRRMIHPVVGTKSAVETQWASIIEREGGRLLKYLVDQPEDFLQLIRTVVGAMILDIIYGYRVDSLHDPIIKLAEIGMADFAKASTPGGFLADLIPLLKYWCLPGLHTSTVKVMRKNLNDFLNVPFAFAKKQMAAGSYNASFSSQKLAEKDRSPTEEEDIKWAALALFGGGADTTAATISFFILAMTLYPEVQKKAQAELDHIVGSGRLPTLGDRDNLPYLTALMKETLRWIPSAPLNVPHVSTQDDEYDGYFIPKGTVVTVNQWGILHDPEIYPDPMEFKPERFLSGGGKEPELDPHNAGFGFGRRQCPGIHFADASVTLVCAMLLSTFNISKAVVDGVVIEPIVGFSGLISHPEPFKCSITPRSKHALEMILDLEC